MRIRRTTAAALALSTIGVTALAACGGGGTSGAGSPDAKGGTLYYLTKRPTEHLDPQRTYIGRDLANLNRIAYRALVSFPVSPDASTSTKPVADLATDTGTSSQGGKVWSFTLRDGVTWQDGKAITCADLKYGLARSFATDVLTGGPNYQLAFLDLPKDPKTGLPRYNGPYKKANQADFDKAVTCDGKTITYRFAKPFPDFPLAIAALGTFNPYRQDQDQGDKSNFAVFSDGPYKLQGKWDVAKGGTFVRNDQWKQSTDPFRKARPDKIVFVQGLTNETIADRLIADAGNDKAAVTDRVVPPAYYTQITGPVAKRSSLNDSPYVDYLVPNFRRIKDLDVRRALMLATNKQGWVTAGGGAKAYKAAKSVVDPSLVGYQDNPNFTAPAGGDPAAAKKLLQQSGVKLPYPIKFTYPGGTPTSDKQAAALGETWGKAGFKVKLDPLPDTYYDVVQKPSNDSDVMYGSWGADWPAISTVIPALFDSRINLTSNSTGQDYGLYRSDKVNAMIDKAALAPSVDAAASIYAQIDDQLGKDVAYVPLDIQRFYLLHGSSVTHYLSNPATNGFADLAVVGVGG